MAIKNKEEDYLAFPVLYDTAVYKIYKIAKFFYFIESRRKVAHKKVYYNYDTNKFEIPKKDFDILSKAKKFASVLAIINSVGYIIV